MITQCLHNEIMMENFSQRLLRFYPWQAPSKVFSLLVLLLLIAAVPLTVYLAQQQQNIRSKAQTVLEQSPKEDDESKKPEFVKGEILVKLRQGLQLRRKGVSAQVIDLDKEVVEAREIDEATLPFSLKRLNQEYQIQKIEKVFKSFTTPQQEISKLRQKMSAKEIPERQINEEELLKIDLSTVYKISFDEKIPVEVVLGQLRSLEVVYAEPNFIYKTTQITPPSATLSASLIFSPTTKSITPGATFDVELSFNAGANNITGLDITIRYNKDVLEMTSFQPSAMFNNQLINQVDNKEGTLRYSAVNTSQNNTGNINIGTITFSAKKEGISNVAFENVQITALGQSGSLPITSNITGSYTVTTATLTPNDPYYLDQYPDNIGNRDPNWNPSYDYQWNLKRINMLQAWEIATPSAQVLVAVIDTGVDYTHPELGECTLEQVNNNQCSRVAPGFDFVNDDDDPMDDANHGTHVAGIIASITNNNRGIAGMSPNVKIIPLKGLGAFGSGGTNDLARAIYEAISRGARVINASWIGIGTSQTLTNAVTFAYLNNVIFVASAGNSSLDVVGFRPANITCATSDYPDRDCTLTVASTDQNDTRSSFSNWGTMIDLSAPGGEGGNVLSLKSSQGQQRNGYMIGAEYTRMSGTSMAAPHVAALAAMVLGKDPALTADQTRNILINGVDDLGTPSFDNQYGYGRINAERTLRSMDTSTPPVAKISSPLIGGFLLGKKIKIFGSVYGQNFSRYNVEHSYSGLPDSWSTSGITLEGSGRSPVYGGLLATADLGSEPNGNHYLRLTTYIGEGKSAFTVISVRLDGSIRDNFPIPFGSLLTFQKPVVADLNGDGRKEIIFKNFNDMKIYAIEPDGTNLSGWPKSTGDNPAGWFFGPHSPTVLDIDPSYPGIEVVVTASSPEGSSQAGIAPLAFHADGTEVSGWTTQDWERRGYLFSTSDTVSSIVVNGQNAVVWAEWGQFSPDRQKRIHVLGRDGNNLPGWPVDIDDSANLELTPVVADIDRDGNAEIIVEHYRKIRLYSNAGTLRREIQISSDDGGYISNIAAADLDNDGFFEIIATTRDYSNPDAGSVSAKGARGQSTTIGRVYVWDHQGNLKSNRFPLVLRDTQYLYFGLLTIGDFDNDNYPEILTFLSDKYYLIDKDGNFVRGFPASGLISYFGGPSLGVNATLDNNNHLLAVGGARNWSSLDLYEYNTASGVLSRSNGYPKDFSAIGLNLLGATGSPSLIDIDGDGKLEVIVPAELGFWETSGSYLYVFNSDYSARVLDWPQYLHDEGHTGTYVGASPSVTPTRLSLSLKLQGIGSEGRENRNPVRRERIVSLQVLNDAREQVSSTSAVLRFDGNNFVGTANLGALNSSQYYFKAKADNSLSKLLNSLPVSITPGRPVATQSGTLTMGDINNDNNINISDFTTLRTCFSSRTSSPNWNICQAADFNDDGRISVVDYSRLVTNFFQRGE